MIILLLVGASNLIVVEFPKKKNYELSSQSATLHQKYPIRFISAQFYPKNPLSLLPFFDIEYLRSYRPFLIKFTQGPNSMEFLFIIHALNLNNYFIFLENESTE